MRPGSLGAASIAAACSIGFAWEGEAAEPPPIAAFVEPEHYSNVQISPTGEYLSATMRTKTGDEDADGAEGAEDDGDSRTFRVQTYPGGEIKVNRDFGGRGDIAALTWVGDHDLVVAPARRTSSGALGFTGELMSVSVRTATAKRMGFGALLDALPDDAKRILFLTGRDRFGEVRKGRLGTDISQRVARGAAPWGIFVPDGKGGIAFSSGRTADNQIEVHYRQGRQEWQVVERHAYGEAGWRPLWPTAAAHKYYTVDYRRGTTTGLGIYDAAADEHEPLVVQHPQVDVTNHFYDFGRRNLWGVRFDHHYPEVVYVAPKHPRARIHAMLREQYPNDYVAITSSSRDHSLVVAEISGDRKPGDFVLVDVRAGNIQPIASRRPNLPSDALSAVSPVEFKVRDGMTVYGYLTSHASAKMPGSLVVLVHGGPHGLRDYWGFHWEAQLLASRGHHVLQVNYRGSGGYGVEYEKAGFGEWGGLMQDDLTDATRWAAQSGIAEADRICIFGGSYGGYAALMGAAKEPQLYRCAIGVAGIYDLAVMERFGDVRLRRSGVHYLRQVLGQDKDIHKQRSPVHQASRIEAAVMLAHGGLDRRAPLEHAQRMRDALRDAGQSVEWYVDAQQGHGFQANAREELYRRILTFLDTHIGAPRPTELADRQPLP